MEMPSNVAEPLCPQENTPLVSDIIVLSGYVDFFSFMLKFHLLELPILYQQIILVNSLFHPVRGFLQTLAFVFVFFQPSTMF